MKIICLIDSINSGGAQRQLCIVAKILKQRGFQTEILYFRKSDFYKNYLDENGIPCTCVEGKTKFTRLYKVIRELKCNKPDIVISYLSAPSVIAELGKLLQCDYKLIVSERSFSQSENAISKFMRFNLHRCANAVVSNSYSQFALIQKEAKWLVDKTKIIFNCLDLSMFVPTVSDFNNSLKILVVARYLYPKNPLILIKAIRQIKNINSNLDIVVNWYGNNYFLDGKPTRYSQLYLESCRMVAEYGLEDCFFLQQHTNNIIEQYYRASVVCLPTYYEGQPNSICEAMACGKPIIASDVCDHSIYVKKNINGFLFDPHSYIDLSEKILRFYEMDTQLRFKMGIESRKMAEALFSPDICADKYTMLVNEITSKNA